MPEALISTIFAIIYCIKLARVTDPACGSGAFLNQCFDYLHEEMDFLLDMKTQFDPQSSFFDIDKEILQNNLFGVDINPESVEITKLSLWLKTAKNNQTLATLDGNIKCGNSIVADPTVAENAFDWHNEFPEVFAKGGFDIVVGNPPYGATVDQAQKEYCVKQYKTVAGGFDTYRVFFELGFMLLRDGGYLGYITPNTYFDIKSGKKLREYLFANVLLKIVELYNVFPNAVVEPLISIYQKQQSMNEELEIILVPRKTALTSTFIADGIHSTKRQSDLQRDHNLVFNYKIDSQTEAIVEKIKQSFEPLITYCEVYNGAKPYEVGKGTPPQTKTMTEAKVYNGYQKLDDTWIPYMRGKRIERFTTMWDGEYIKYGENPAAPRNPDIFFCSKIFIRQTGDTIIAQIDVGNVANNTLHIVVAKSSDFSDRYLLGLLNSTWMSWYFQATHPLEVGKPMAEVKKHFVEQLPIALANQEQRETVIDIVDQLLTLCQKRHEERQGFVQYIARLHEPKNITEKLEKFDQISFKELCAELKKQRVSLSAAEQMALLPLYDQKCQEIVALTTQIKRLQTQLDDEVFAIYDIDSDTATRIRQEMPINL